MSTIFNSRGQAIVPSAGMEDALTRIASAYESEYSGIGLHSQTRFGKTTLAEYICSYHDWFSVKYVARRAVVRDIGSGENAFLDWFLSKLGVHVVARQHPELKFDRIVSTVSMQLQMAGAGCYMFIVDDANLLDPRAFQHFVSIDERLSDNGVRLFVVFLFQDYHTSGKEEKINTLVTAPQVKSRFLTRYHRVHGIRGVEDAALFLERFEDEVEMAPGAGISLPRHVAPALYETKFRMRYASEMLWEQGSRIRVAAGHSPKDEWPMKSFWLIAFHLTTRTICQVGFSDFNVEQVVQAIRFSDLAVFDGISGAVEISRE